MLCDSQNITIVKEAVWPLIEMGDVTVAFGVCNECGHIQQSPCPSDALLTDYYANFSNYTVLNDEWSPPKKPDLMQARYLSLANKHKPQKGNVYELGASIGLTLHYFNKDGWTVAGCEPSPTACEQAKSFFGFNIDQGFEEDYLPAKSDLDIVLMSHVLEHVTDPAGTISRIHGALADDGLFIFEVPNASKAELIPPGWFAFEHLSYFTKETLTYVLNKSGFEVVDCYEDDNRIIYPVIGMVARKALKTPHAKPKPETIDKNLQFAMEVVSADTAAWKQSLSKIVSNTGPFYVWAAGVHTSQLFGETRLPDKIDIAGVIDSDSQKWGKTIAGYEILSPEEANNVLGGKKIIISSYGVWQAIRKALLDMGIDACNIVSLYD